MNHKDPLERINYIRNRLLCAENDERDHFIDYSDHDFYKKMNPHSLVRMISYILDTMEMMVNEYSRA